jgi:murein DD-endopeptidase MepM/ murein hydrolase activator NlpD
MIIIDHLNTYKTTYSHLAGYNVNEGDTVEKGDLIGFMGTSGRSTGVHLHYQILKDNEPVDPYPFMTFLND